ncbi:response regulator [Agrobacterium sp. ES01]|uniref:response regulator n=1 Tax=Agrobacterium sp. ES01 TaxID=3420714 RepID=UPI003D0BED8D
MTLSQNETPMETILVLEDNPMLALDAATAVADAGFDVAITARCGEALAMLEGVRFKCAILDFNLLDGDSVIVAKRLMEMGTPFRIVSGRPIAEIASSGIPADFILAKPADYHDVTGMLTRMHA